MYWEREKKYNLVFLIQLKTKTRRRIDGANSILRKKKINYLEEGVLKWRPRFSEAMKDFGYSYFMTLKHTSYAFIHKA